MELLIGILINYLVVAGMKANNQRAYDQIANDLAINYSLHMEALEELKQCRGEE